ncbi:MAG: multidrug effflux MFS transporter [Legionellales bacterium]|nr:multidrug effflux MFS transporter [Legionellales bacterium]
MNKSIVRLILILSPMALSLPLAMDIYVPAVPQIAQLFAVSAGKMQITLTLFMLTAGIMQLIVGPLSDQCGRKKISLFMIVFFALGTLLCSTAQSLTALMFYRIVQAIGSCGMMILAFAIVRDRYHGEQSAQIYSFLNGIISFSPMFAPFIGGYLDVHFSWPATFLSLLVIAVIAFITIQWGLTESHPMEKRQVFDHTIFKQYFTISQNRIFICYTLATSMGLSYLYLFCSISPYIIIRQLHIPILHYGYYFCFMGISFFIGSFLSSYIVTKIGIYQTVVTGFILSFIGGLMMTIWFFITGLTINNFIWPMILIGIGGTFCMGAGNGGSMEPFSQQVGRAAALGGACRFMFSALVGSIVITQNVTSTLPLALPAIVFSIIGLIFFMRGHQYLNFRRKL